MAEFNGSKTQANLLEAFAGESQARNMYTYFASVARKEGYEQIAAIFTETAENEKEHAKLHFKALEKLGDTAANLQAAADGENEETTGMYPRMANEAREEGFDKIARQFELIGQIEAHHRDRYRQLLANLKEETLFVKEKKVRWHCRNCGYVYEGEKAMAKCPCCDHPQSYFEIEATNY